MALIEVKGTDAIQQAQQPRAATPPIVPALSPVADKISSLSNETFPEVEHAQALQAMQFLAAAINCSQMKKETKAQARKHAEFLQNFLLNLSTFSEAQKVLQENRHSLILRRPNDLQAAALRASCLIANDKDTSGETAADAAAPAQTEATEAPIVASTSTTSPGTTPPSSPAAVASSDAQEVSSTTPPASPPKGSQEVEYLLDDLIEQHVRDLFLGDYDLKLDRAHIRSGLIRCYKKAFKKANLSDVTPENEKILTSLTTTDWEANHRFYATRASTKQGRQVVTQILTKIIEAEKSVQSLPIGFQEFARKKTLIPLLIQYAKEDKPFDPTVLLNYLAATNQLVYFQKPTGNESGLTLEVYSNLSSDPLAEMQGILKLSEKLSLKDRLDVIKVVAELTAKKIDADNKKINFATEKAQDHQTRVAKIITLYTPLTLMLKQIQDNDFRIACSAEAFLTYSKNTSPITKHTPIVNLQENPQAPFTELFDGSAAELGFSKTQLEAKMKETLFAYEKVLHRFKLYLVAFKGKGLPVQRSSTNLGGNKITIINEWAQMFRDDFENQKKEFAGFPFIIDPLDKHLVPPVGPITYPEVKKAD